MGTAEGTIRGRVYFTRVGLMPRHRLAEFLRRLRLMKPEPTLEQRYKTSITKAIECAKSMNMEAALKHLNDATHSCGSSPEVILLKGMVYMDMGNLKLAEQAFRASIEALKVAKGSGSTALFIFVEEYMRMRHDFPAPGVKPICYIPVQNAFRDASIGAFGQTDKNIAYTLFYAKGGLQ
jgi:hypothetical protein